MEEALDPKALDAAKKAYDETIYDDNLGDAEYVVRAYLNALSTRGAMGGEATCPHNCDEGGICLAELSGYPGSCPRPLKETEGKWLLVKRGLYERPDHMGYTGIRDNAGLYSEAEAEDSVQDGSYGVSMIRYEDASDFTDACFDDLARKHLQDKIKSLRDALRAALGNTTGADPVAWPVAPEPW